MFSINQVRKREVARRVQRLSWEQPMDCEEQIASRDAGHSLLGTAVHGTNAGILLVEDQHLVREVAAEVLRFAGYCVWKAASASEAVQVFQDHPADIKLLITDVALPDDRGPDLAARLRAAGGRFRTILISGYPERMVVKGAHPESLFLYLPKPFSAESLTRTVKQALSLLQMSQPTHCDR